MKAVQKIMLLLPAAALIVAPMAQAGGHYKNGHYKKAPVVNTTPIYETLERVVPTEVCYDERVPVRQARRHSATGPILGALIGGAIGNAVGHKKSNKRVGAVVGAVLGGSIGADISRRHRVGQRDVYRNETVCRVVDEVVDERVLTGYTVTYRYAGETYTTRMDRDPGRHLKVRVSVTPV